MARRSAQSRQQELIAPPVTTLDEVREAAASCKECPLWKIGTQTVFGEGSVKSRIMFVGEQPGNDEDLAGRPFVGPAGKILDKALAEAGIERSKTYVTNAVKHFKWILRGKRRIHDKPNAAEISACRPWLDSEITLVKPKILVCLGATAAQTLIGRQFRVTLQRGKFVPSPLAPFVMATIHPSAILRSADDETRRAEMARFIQDLKVAQKALASLG